MELSCLLRAWGRARQACYQPPWQGEGLWPVPWTPSSIPAASRLSQRHTGCLCACLSLLILSVFPNETNLITNSQDIWECSSHTAARSLCPGSSQARGGGNAGRWAKVTWDAQSPAVGPRHHHTAVAAPASHLGLGGTLGVLSITKRWKTLPEISHQNHASLTKQILLF